MHKFKVVGNPQLQKQQKHTWYNLIFSLDNVVRCYFWCRCAIFVRVLYFSMAKSLQTYSGLQKNRLDRRQCQQTFFNKQWRLLLQILYFSKHSALQTTGPFI